MSQQPNQQGSACTAAPCEHGQALKLLNTDVEAMRQLITCKICDRLMYEPYALSCGHTYCYQCLGSWFGNNPHKKTCPDCRVVITQQPTPSYIVREIVLVFTSRNELLPDGETSDEHHQWSKEEAELVAKDKANTDNKTGGLFKGMFKRGARYNLMPIHDPGDGVDRCPVCHWELEDAYCSRCDEYADGRDFSDYDDESELTEDELDHEIDEEDAAAFFGADELIDLDSSSMDGQANSHLGLGEYGNGRNFRNFNPHLSIPEGALIGMLSDDEEEEDEHASDVDADGNLRSFVVDDDEVAYAGSDEGEDTDVPVVTRQRQVGSRRSPLVIEDDDTAASTAAPATEEDDEDSEDEGPIARGTQRNKRASRVALRQRPSRRISSDESSSDSDNSNRAVEHEQDDNSVNLGGFSPLNEEGSEAATSTRYDSNDDDDDDNDLGTIDESNEDDDDGWDTPVETRRDNRSSGPTRGAGQGQYVTGHSSNFGGRYRERPTSSGPGQLTTTIRAHASTTDHPHRHPTYSFHGVGHAPRTVQSVMISRSRAPSHPFQLGDTLARVNGSYNQRLHGRPIVNTSRRGHQSSSASGRDSTPRPVGDVRRKRALSIDSDDTVGATYGGHTY